MKLSLKNISLYLYISLCMQPAHADKLPSRTDLARLERLTYGIDSDMLNMLEQQGRSRFMREQLRPSSDRLPEVVQQQLDTLAVSHTTAIAELAQISAENQRINALTDNAEKENARKQLNDRGNLLAYEAQRRHLLYALYSPSQLREQMVWFWLNHFSVHQYKANLRWLVGDYEMQAIRPHALGQFRDLVLATLRHPAMLQFLDNAQNAVGHVNENYARELMELHTLGVNAGYTQQDVQELARILTGVGINASENAPKLKREWLPLYEHDGAFEFNPARHDFGTKTLLGRTFSGGGMDEIEAAIDWLVNQPACAQFISTKLAVYFMGQPPSPALSRQLVQIFTHTHGDISALLNTLFESREFEASLGHEFKDPMHYVVSSVRLAYDGKVIANTHPLVNWLNALGEPLFGRQTPDGYPLTESSWNSSGQLSKRFEIARTIGAGNAGLFDPENGTANSGTGFPQLSSRLYYASIEPTLSGSTRAALSQAASQAEWNTYLLASPELNYR
jgi:uncharacterized protein (DUF1800 family)